MRFAGLIAVVGMVASSCLFAGNASGGSRHQRREPTLEKHNPHEKEGLYRRPQQEISSGEDSIRTLESSLNEVFETLQTINSGRRSIRPTN